MAEIAKDYYYEVLENGYYVKDHNNPSLKYYQYENDETGEDYILFRTDKSDKDYAKYAQMFIDDLKKRDAEAEKEIVTLEKLSQKISNLEKQNASLIMSDAKNAKVIDGLKSQNANLMLSDAQKTKEINILKEKIATLEEGAPTV